MKDGLVTDTLTGELCLGYYCKPTTCGDGRFWSGCRNAGLGVGAGKRGLEWVPEGEAWGREGRVGDRHFNR